MLLILIDRSNEKFVAMPVCNKIEKFTKDKIDKFSSLEIRSFLSHRFSSFLKGSIDFPCLYLFW